jgi:hypothetical protein
MFYLCYNNIVSFVILLIKNQNEKGCRQKMAIRRWSATGRSARGNYL